MKYQPTCFVSYAHVDRPFVQSAIVPILEEFGIRVWVDYQQIDSGYFIADSILRGIRQADLIIAVFNKRSTFMNFEVGAAIGQSKPTIAIVREDQPIPSDIRHIAFLRYSGREEESFKRRLRASIGISVEQVIDKSVQQIAQGRKVIGIRVGFEKIDVEQELRFTADFVHLIKNITSASDVTLIETRHGTLKSFLSIDFKPLAELVEKILFFIPEWKRKKAEVLKIHAETAKIQAEADQVNTTSYIAEEKLRIEQAEATANLLLKYKDLGIKIQVDNELLLTLTPSGCLQIQRPKRLEESADR